jgi:branched-chain amino acid transport system substrate-binding protein
VLTFGKKMHEVRQPRRLGLVLASGALALGALIVNAAVGAAPTALTPPPPSKNVLMGGSKYTGKPQGTPVKLLTVNDVAGKFGSFGPSVIEAAKLMVKLANQNGGIMGRPVTLTVRDDQASAAVAARETLTQFRTNKPDFLFGENLSDALLAQAPLTQRFRVPTISVAGDIQFVSSGPAGHASIYQGMASATTETDACGFALFASRKHPKWKTFATLAANFVFGTDEVKDFKRCIKKYNPQAQIVTEQIADLGTTNFLPIINAITSKKPDFIFASLFDGDLIRMINQYKGVGPTIPMASFMDLDTVKGLGNGIPKGLIYTYIRGLYTELPYSKPFVAAFRKEYKKIPTDNSFIAMGAFLAYKTAVEKARSFDPLKVMRAFRCERYFEPRGWVKVRPINGAADVPDYMGLLVPDTKLGHPKLDARDRLTIYSHQVWQSDATMKKLVPKDAQWSCK